MSLSLKRKRWQKSRWKFKRCKHGWCSDCKTKRGRNRGNRTVRHETKAQLHAGQYE